jgi:hypothetical protein
MIHYAVIVCCAEFYCNLFNLCVVFPKDLMMSSLHAIESTLQEPDLVDAGEQSEDIETEDDHEASDTDQEHDVRVNGQNLAEGSACLRFIYIKFLSVFSIKLWSII